MAESMMRVIRCGTIAGLAGLTFGCFNGDPGAIPLLTSPSDALGAVTLSSAHNAILAVGGTLQMGFSATSLAGVPVTQLDSVIYMLASSADTVRTTVSRTTGLVTAVGVTTAPVPINVVAFRSGTMRGDQLLVQVTATPVSGLTLSIQPPAGDSAKLAMGVTKTIIPVLRNATTGASVAGAQFDYDLNPADRTRVNVSSATISLAISGNPIVVRLGAVVAAKNQIVPLVAEGSAWIYANVNVYGTLLQDSVRYTFSYPFALTVATNKTNLALTTLLNSGSTLAQGTSGTLALAAGGIITFSSGVSATDLLKIAYTFDNPAVATAPATSPSTTGGASGDVTALTGGQNSRRQFLTPGTYHWTTVATGGPAPWPGQTFMGTIVVKP